MADPITYTDFAKLELRVAKVLEVRPHPNADRLLLLQVDVGDQQKQIVAGIRHHYEPEQLVGKLIVIVNNLEPAMLRGEPSNGMLLAATSGRRWSSSRWTIRTASWEPRSSDRARKLRRKSPDGNEEVRQTRARYCTVIG